MEPAQAYIVSWLLLLTQFSKHTPASPIWVHSISRTLESRKDWRFKEHLASIATRFLFGCRFARKTLTIQPHLSHHQPAQQRKSTMLSMQTSRIVSSSLRKASEAPKRHLLTVAGRTGRSRVGSALSRRPPTDGGGYVGGGLVPWKSAVRCLGTTSHGTTTRSKSSVAYADEEHDDYDFEPALESRPSQGHAAAASAEGASGAKSHVEAWTINLGRKNDNAWLTGDREDKWWTGVHPRDCPGTFAC